MDALLAFIGRLCQRNKVEGLDFDYVPRTQAGWDFGRRAVFCSLHRLDGTMMTGTAQVSS